MAQEWNIRHRGHECSICGCKFKDKQKCASLLREVDRSYERMDCCIGCWDALERDWEPFSLWDGIYRAPKPAELKKEPVRKDTAEILLRKLIDMEDPAMRNVVYVLAIMLERGKQLVERDTQPHESGGILRIYEDKLSGDTFIVLDPKLRLDKLAIVQQQVVALLSGTQTLGEEKSDEKSEVRGEKSELISDVKSEESVALERSTSSCAPQGGATADKSNIEHPTSNEDDQATPDSSAPLDTSVSTDSN